MAAGSGFLLRQLLILGVVSSVVIATGTSEGNAKTEEKREAVANDNSEASEDGKDKRSQEEIMFGNQQNKPSGLVNDLMGMPDRMGSDASNAEGGDNAAKNATQTQDGDEKLEEVLKDDKEDDKQKSLRFDYYDLLAEEPHYGENYISQRAVQPQDTLRDSQVYELPSENGGDYNNYDYNDEIFRRKRQLLGHPLPLRKRSLRSPLGQMMTRNRRFPRRSMRLKRQVDVEDLLSMLGNLEYSDRYYDEQMPPNYDIQGLPHLPEVREPNFRYPYSFVRQQPDDQEAVDDQEIGPERSYIDNDIALPYRVKDDEESAKVPNWMIRHPPTVFSVARRSSPLFYPLDYRYMSGYKKRSHGRMNSDAEEQTDFGKWGTIVQVPEAYASAEDVARLYALANLLAEAEEPEVRLRRSL